MVLPAMVKLYLNMISCALIGVTLSGCLFTSMKKIAGMHRYEAESSKTSAGSKISWHYKVGNKYTINGTTYRPTEYDSYDEIGIASWYGHGFEYGRTANGDVFDSHFITAAHKTLPLPSIVKVTNLENGNSLTVLINDRGPFVKNRIIDLSERAAVLLGFHDHGTAKVRVKYLKAATQALLNNASREVMSVRQIENIYNDNTSNAYSSKIFSAVSAKELVSKLRTQMVSNVRWSFKDGYYYVNIG